MSKSRYSPPVFKLAGLPPTERHSVLHLERAMRDLYSHAHDFAACVRLFDHALEGIRLYREERSKLYEKAMNASSTREMFALLERRNNSDDGETEWLFIAARDAAMQIHHIGEAMKLIKGTFLRECPTLRSRVDGRHFRRALKLFDSYFPNQKAIRDTVGHLGERDSREHMVTAADMQPLMTGTGRVSVTGALIDRTYTYTIGAKVMSFDVSAETLQKIDRVLGYFSKAFEAMVWPIDSPQVTHPATA